MFSEVITYNNHWKCHHVLCELAYSLAAIFYAIFQLFMAILFSPCLITTEDEEREQLAKEISKDWSSGNSFFFIAYVCIYHFNLKFK